MVWSRARPLAHRHHRPAHGKTHHVSKGHHPAVDHRQPSRNAASLDPLAIITAQIGASCVVERKAAATDREMAACGAKRARDVFVVVPLSEF
jgi:hypothetical protein